MTSSQLLKPLSYSSFSLSSVPYFAFANVRNSARHDGEKQKSIGFPE